MTKIKNSGLFGTYRHVPCPGHAEYVNKVQPVVSLFPTQLSHAISLIVGNQPVTRVIRVTADEAIKIGERLSQRVFKEAVESRHDGYTGVSETTLSEKHMGV